MGEQAERRMSIGSSQQYNYHAADLRTQDILARHSPNATITDREYMAMRAAETIEEWRRKN
jgi:hypothetical protein